jgi:mono/diheme cytochrome c family protein
MSEQQENRDYDHKQSVRDCASIANHQTEENPKPHQGTEPFPVWLLIICVIILIVGGSYVGANSGGFEFANNNKSGYEPGVPAGLSGKAPELSEFEKYVKGGEAVYKAVCNGCHQATGAGQGQIPPLVESEWVINGTERFAQIVLNGMRGPIIVKGVSYGGQEMPAQKGALNDKQVAQVMTYVRSKFGNINESIVTKEMIEIARQKFGDRPNQYTSAELSPAQTMLPGDQPEWLAPEEPEAKAEPEPEPQPAGESARIDSGQTGNELINSKTT